MSQRVCTWCHSGISEQRPVFLITNPEGQIIGPYHAGCAERVKIEWRKRRELLGVSRATQLGLWPSAREETLPE